MSYRTVAAFGIYAGNDTPQKYNFVIIIYITLHKLLHYFHVNITKQRKWTEWLPNSVVKVYLKYTSIMSLLVLSILYENYV